MDAATTLVFQLTARQRVRYGAGIAGVATIVWSLAVVRLVVTDRLPGEGGLLAVVLLTAALGAAGVAAFRASPVVVLSADAAHLRWGPFHRAVAWTDVTDVRVRERGVARRVVLRTDDGHAVLPVPLTGGSIISPGPDPALDEKAELVRGWWLDRRRP